MEKKLVRTGNSLALVLDKALLEQTGITSETILDVSTDGDVIVISPVREGQRIDRLRRVMARAHSELGGAFERLAK
jgi:antitoxin MazE